MFKHLTYETKNLWGKALYAGPTAAKSLAPVAAEWIARNLPKTRRKRRDEHVAVIVVVRGPAAVALFPVELVAGVAGSELSNSLVEHFAGACVAMPMHDGNDSTAVLAGQQYPARPDPPPEGASNDGREKLENRRGALRFS